MMELLSPSVLKLRWYTCHWQYFDLICRDSYTCRWLELPMWIALAPVIGPERMN